MPIARTMPNNVNTLIENPSIQSPMHEPSNAMGTTIVGMMVARQFWRKRYMTRKTRIMASPSVFATSVNDTSMNSVVSNGTAHRSEEHTSELQSLMRISYAVFCLKKQTHTYHNKTTIEI